MEVLDSKAWQDAYKDYKKSDHYKAHRLSDSDWKSMVLGKGPKPKPKHRQTHKKQASKKRKPIRKKTATKRTWLDIHREFLRWKKTPEFEEWKYKQFLKQGGTCYYCDEPLNGARQNVEHIIPKIRGGDNHLSNLVLACWRCNKEKYTKVLSRAERLELKEKNRKKKGTYLMNREKYSEENIAYSLRQMFREDW